MPDDEKAVFEETLEKVREAAYRGGAVDGRGLTETPRSGRFGG